MTSPTNNSSSVFHRNLIDEKGIDHATGFSQEGQDQRFRVILNRCLRTPITGKRVLDYGCNVGGLLDYIWHDGKYPPQLDYTGVDLMPEFLARLREKFPTAELLVGNIVEDDTFDYLSKLKRYDYVIASGAFCYADQWEDHPIMLRRLWELTSDTLVVNFLSSLTEKERKTSKITHCLYPPSFGARLAELLNCKYFRVIADYRDNDFTVALYRTPA